ncbi:MAG: hypothetical protein U0T74_02755 [Chitinophagales bacterium]
MRTLWIVTVCVFFIASCSKTNDVIVPGNVPPPDHTIDSSTIEIYLNKVYINLLGREPVGNEKSDGMMLLRQNNFSETTRQQFLESIFAKPDYMNNLFTVANHEYLSDLDSMEIVGQVTLYNLLLSQPQYAPFYDVLQYEIDRMEILLQTRHDLITQTIDYRQMLQRCTNNYFYDQINMGTENFVISTFQNFLFRYPTDAELANGKTMVDGNNAVLFFQLGKSKTDYLNVFFSSNDYYEGQVRNTFRKYLFREPTSAEEAYYSEIYKQAGEYKSLQKAVLALDEYAGI